MTVPLRILDHRPLRGGLDSVALDLPAGEDDWKQGVYVQPESRNEVFVWDASCNDDGYLIGGNQFSNQASNPPVSFDEKRLSGIPSEYEFAPTFIVAHAACTVGGTVSVIGDLIEQAARNALEQNKWRALAAVLHGAAPVFTQNDHGHLPNPSLTGAVFGVGPTYPTGFSAASPGDLKGTMQGLLDGICECQKGDLTFHVPVAFLPYFLVDGFVRWDTGAQKYTFGTHEVSFDCYPNQGSFDVEQATPTATDGTEVWIWATGPIYTAFGAGVEVRDLERRQNQAAFLAEMPAIVAYDPACTRAAKARVA